MFLQYFLADTAVVRLYREVKCKSEEGLNTGKNAVKVALTYNMYMWQAGDLYEYS